ncbi:MAG TPA: inositol monophosphatase family protein [Oligoflexia bacterium]|nr:inositol monophosphatase family protein [Oligoflexia bacterium]HMP49559.1 inositol monophosphatase family protein [Oligoflexia bacterium]
MYQTTCERAAREGAKIVLHYFNHGFQLEEKSPANLVTEADIKTEQVIIEAIKREFPDHEFLGEEGSKASTDAPHLWIIDPIDGTNNFAHGIPHSGISIAYAENGEVLAGVVYQPFSDEMFAASKGCGATLNGKPIKATNVATISQAMVATGFYYDYRPDITWGLKTIELLIKNECHGVRRFGAASLDLCYVASGRFDAYYELRLNAWDFAAGMLIAREAGSKVTNVSGQDLTLKDTQLIAANPNLFNPLKALIEEAGVLLAPL